MANANGCSSSTTTTVLSDTALPTVSLMTSNSLNCSVTSATLSASATGVGSLTYTFSGESLPGSPSSNSSVTINQGGSYSVLVTAANGCTVSQSTSVVSNTAPPVASLVASGSINCTQASVTLTASGGTSYSFANASGTIGTPGLASTIEVSAGGTYSVTVANANGCSSSTTTTVLSDTAVPGVSLLALSQTFCAGTTLTLTASGGTAYTFSSGATQTGGSRSNTATVTQTGVYTVIVSAATGCTNTATISVTATPITSLVNGPPAGSGFCVGSSVVALVNATGTPPLSYRWYQNGSPVTGQLSATLSLPSAQTTDAGSYSVVVTGACTSVTSTAFSLTVNALPSVTVTASLNAGPPSTTLSCANPSLTLTAQTSATAFAWNNGGSTSPTLPISQSGTYSVTVTDGNGCTAVSNSLNISQDLTLPPFSVNSVSLCQGQATSLLATGCSGLVVWSTGTTGSSLTLTTGSSTSVLSATCTVGNCNATASGSVVIGQILPPPAAILSLQADESACPVRLVGRATGTSFVFSNTQGYVFSNVYRTGGTYDISGLAVKQPGVYTLTATYANECGTSVPVSQTVNVSRSCP